MTLWPKVGLVSSFSGRLHLIFVAFLLNESDVFRSLLRKVKKKTFLSRVFLMLLDSCLVRPCAIFFGLYCLLVFLNVGHLISGCQEIVLVRFLEQNFRFQFELRSLKFFLVEKALEFFLFALFLWLRLNKSAQFFHTNSSCRILSNIRTGYPHEFHCF